MKDLLTLKEEREMLALRLDVRNAVSSLERITKAFAKGFVDERALTRAKVAIELSTQKLEKFMQANADRFPLDGDARWEFIQRVGASGAFSDPEVCGVDCDRGCVYYRDGSAVSM